MKKLSVFSMSAIIGLSVLLTSCQITLPNLPDWPIFNNPSTNTIPVVTNTPPVVTNTPPVVTNAPPVETNTPPVVTNAIQTLVKPINVACTSDPSAISSLKENGKAVALYVGLNVPTLTTLPDIIVCGPKAPSIAGTWQKWLPVYKEIKTRYPSVPVGFECSGDEHPVYFNLLKQKVVVKGKDFFFFDCTGYSKDRVSGDISKLVNEYSKRQGWGFRMIAVYCDYPSDALKAGADGVVYKK